MLSSLHLSLYLIIQVSPSGRMLRQWICLNNSPYFWRPNICSTIFYRSPMALHTLRILIVLHNSSDFIPHLSISQNHCWKILIWSWYYNWRSWTTQRIFQGTKHCSGSAFDKSLHNGYSFVPTSLIHCVDQWCLQAIHYKYIWGGFLAQLSSNYSQ